MITRRGILQGLVSFVAAPTVIRIADIMPVRSFIEAEPTKVIIPTGSKINLSQIRELLLPGLKQIQMDYFPMPKEYQHRFMEPPK